LIEIAEGYCTRVSRSGRKSCQQGNRGDVKTAKEGKRRRRRRRRRRRKEETKIKG
jgi:hypothetical protein